MTSKDCGKREIRKVKRGRKRGYEIRTAGEGGSSLVISPELQKRADKRNGTEADFSTVAQRKASRQESPVLV